MGRALRGDRFGLVRVAQVSIRLLSKVPSNT